MGFAAYPPPTTWTIQLMRLAVHPAHRRGGIATRLLDHVITDTGCRKITMVLRESNRSGCEVLKKLGFKAVNIIKDRFDDEDGFYFIRKVQ